MGASRPCIRFRISPGLSVIFDWIWTNFSSFLNSYSDGCVPINLPWFFSFVVLKAMIIQCRWRSLIVSSRVPEFLWPLFVRWSNKHKSNKKRTKNGQSVTKQEDTFWFCATWKSFRRNRSQSQVNERFAGCEDPPLENITTKKVESQVNHHKTLGSPKIVSFRIYFVPEHSCLSIWVKRSTVDGKRINPDELQSVTTLINEAEPNQRCYR